MQAAAYPHMNEEGQNAVIAEVNRELRDPEVEALYEADRRQAQEAEWAANRARFGSILAGAGKPAGKPGGKRKQKGAET